MARRTVIQPIEGMDLSSDSMMIRSFGMLFSKRSVRMIRNARNTEKGPAAGTREIATMKKSNRFQPSLKKRKRYVKIFRTISREKRIRITRSKRSMADPMEFITTGNVSSPIRMEFSMITTTISFWKNEDSKKV